LSPIRREKKLNRRVVYQGKILDLYVDSVCITGGRESTREVVGHCPAVAIVPLLANQRVILIQQYRYAVNQVLWEIPAGLIDLQETPRQAAMRELREETGYRAGRLKKVVSIFSSPGFCQEKIHIFLAEDLRQVDSLSLDADEFLTARFISFKKALRMVTQGQIVDGKTILGLTLAAKHFKKF